MPDYEKPIAQSSWTKIVVTILINGLLILVPFYAFISVWSSSAIGHFTAVRLWDDALLLILFVISLGLLLKSKSLIKFIFQDWINRLIFAYSLLTILLGVVSYFNNNVSAKALFYGLLVNLRYLLLFVAIRFLASKIKYRSKHIQKIIFYPLLLVALFGLLQFFVLPHNFLSHFGYGNNTYPQYITINQNSTTIRIQSFLRGSNPLGAYLAAVICILVAFILKNKRRAYYYILLILSVMALYLSFSRSAAIGMSIGVFAVILAFIKAGKSRRIFLIIAASALIVLGAGYLATRNNQGVQDLLFHHSNHSTAVVSSNEGHLSALKTNVKEVLQNPLGKGPGTSGQASWYNNGRTSNPEDYFIQIAEETGWLGLILFVAILINVGRVLWLKRNDALALGLLGGLIAISIISLFSYTWSDDTLAFLWWGLAGICIAG